MMPDETAVLLELAAQVDHEEPDYTELDEAIEAITNPWEELRRVLRTVHRTYL